MSVYHIYNSSNLSNCWCIVGHTEAVVPEILTNIAVVLIGLHTGVGTRIIAAELVEIDIEAIHETDSSICICYSVLSAFSITYCTSFHTPHLLILYSDSSFKYTC